MDCAQWLDKANMNKLKCIQCEILWEDFFQSYLLSLTKFYFAVLCSNNSQFVTQIYLFLKLIDASRCASFGQWNYFGHVKIISDFNPLINSQLNSTFSPACKCVSLLKINIDDLFI